MQLDPLLFSFGLIVVPPAIAFPLADSFDTVDFFDNEPTEYASLDLSDADLINSAADHGPNTDWSFPLLGGLTDTPPVADFSLAALAEGNFETSCNPDPEIHYGKRGEICQPEEAPLSNPALQLRLPDLPDLERILRPPVASQDGHDRLLPIPVTLGVSVDVDDRCPPPLRHLCCQGPTEFFDLALFVWKVVVDCRELARGTCPARYDVCCEDFLRVEVSAGLPVQPMGSNCVILSENPNPRPWD